MFNLEEVLRGIEEDAEKRSVAARLAAKIAEDVGRVLPPGWTASWHSPSNLFFCRYEGLRTDESALVRDGEFRSVCVFVESAVKMKMKKKMTATSEGGAMDLTGHVTLQGLTIYVVLGYPSCKFEVKKKEETKYTAFKLVPIGACLSTLDQED